jgi:hypothetical protein
MIWSFSSYVTFKRCPRSWFYGKVLATRSRSDPESQEAKRLSNLPNRLSWRGKIVDTTLSEYVVPAIAAGENLSLSKALEFAEGLYSPTVKKALERQAGKDNGSSAVFFEEEYGPSISQKMFDDAWHDVQRSIDMFFRDAEFLANLRKASRAIPQRPLAFSSWNVKARAVPDLILFHSDEPPTIIDWKVQSKPRQDYWLQLAIYAIALTRAKKHSDWPTDVSRFAATDITVIESQLLSGEIREHQITPEDVNSIDDLIVTSGDEMNLSLGVIDKKDLTAQNFTAASNPNACMYCNFRKICWVV